MPHTLTRSGQAVAYFTTLLAIAFLSFAPLDASAGQVYKWVDKNGVVSFGSQPPESIPAQRVHVDTYTPPEQPTTEENADTQKAGETDKKDKKKAVTAKKPAKPQMSAAQRQMLCQQARNDLAALQSHGQIRHKDASGNISYMSDQQKQSRIDTDNRNIQQYCR